MEAVGDGRIRMFPHVGWKISAIPNGAHFSWVTQGRFCKNDLLVFFNYPDRPCPLFGLRFDGHKMKLLALDIHLLL